MTIKNRLVVSQHQRLALSPMMRQSLAILRMPLQVLNEEILREAAENPFLVVEQTQGSGTAYEFALATTPARENLSASLSHQIAMQRLDPTTEAAANFLVTELREDGYLDTSLDELAEINGLPIGVLQTGLSALQKCEPVGIGARSLAEFIALRLIDSGTLPSLAQKIVDHLDYFAEQRWSRLTKVLGLDRVTLDRTVNLLRGITSAPVEPDPVWVATTIPEISIERAENGRLNINLLRSALPQISVLHIDRNGRADPTLASYHARACHIQSGISARSETLLRVARYIATTQSGFFLGDHSTIIPVTRADAATMIGLHPSTLGRALAGKALVSDNRHYPLADFFSKALQSAEGAISAFDVQRRIRKIISAESSNSPRTDESICEQLNHEGVDIARRTVAKYRKCMRIPSSFARLNRKA